MNDKLKRFVMDFAESVIRQTEEIGNGDAESGNRYAKRYLKSFEELRAFGDLGREALASLFLHERADVRAMAATFLLRYRTKEALEVLQQVAASGEGLAAFGAEQAIQRWEEGDWRLDPT